MRIDHTDGEHRPAGEYLASDIASRKKEKSKPRWQHLSRFLACERRSFARMLGLPAPRPCKIDEDESLSS